MAHGHSETEKKALKIRIKKIIGQLSSIEKMIDADKDCPEILTQLVSVRKATKSLAEVLIDRHMHHCIEGAQHGESKKKLSELLEVLDRYVE